MYPSDITAHVRIHTTWYVGHNIDTLEAILRLGRREHTSKGKHEPTPTGKKQNEQR